MRSAQRYYAGLDRKITRAGISLSHVSTPHVSSGDTGSLCQQGQVLTPTGPAGARTLIGAPDRRWSARLDRPKHKAFITGDGGRDGFDSRILGRVRSIRNKEK